MAPYRLLLTKCSSVLHVNHGSCIHAVPSGGKLVDIGTGTTVHMLITANDKFKDITYAEYTEVNRKELRKWLSGEQDAFDWNLFFKFVAILLKGVL